MIRNRLFLQIYVTLLACLAAVAIASGVYWRITADRDDLSLRERRDLFAERMLPAGGDPAETQLVVQRLGDALNADIALYAPDGSLLAATAKAPPLPKADEKPRPGKPNALRLKDGRIVVASVDLPGGGPRGRGLGYLLLIAAVVGLAGYPVVRQLTRRLESLRTGVEQFGGGALASRVPVRGSDEVAAVARSFNSAADRIEQLVASHRSLLANASHELRSPLARLRMAVDLYNPKDPKSGDAIIENLDEIDELVEEILLASRLNHVGGLEKSERVDLTAIAAEECARHDVEVSGVPAYVTGDRRLLKRLVRNLVVNAIKHGKPPVEVEIDGDERVSRLIVRDHGEGLPAGEETRIFEAFYRPAGRGESAGGWGLGLALVKQIAELHGGTVRYEGAAAGGARFVVDLPRAG